MTKPLIITSGEPAGIGVDLCLQLANLGLDIPFVVMADPTLLTQRAIRLNLDVELDYYAVGLVRVILIRSRRHMDTATTWHVKSVAYCLA